MASEPRMLRVYQERATRLEIERDTLRTDLASERSAREAAERDAATQREGAAWGEALIQKDRELIAELVAALEGLKHRPEDNTKQGRALARALQRDPEAG